MEILKDFLINIAGLKQKKYSYEIEGNDDFFAAFTNSLIQKGSFKVGLILDKNELMLTADFDLKGSLELICDRCLEPFDFKIDQQERIYFKFIDDKFAQEAEDSDDIVLIARDIAQLDTAQYVYEFLCLSVPMKKIHPKFAAQDEDNDDDLLIYSSKTEEDTSEQNTDDRWSELKKLL